MRNRMEEEESYLLSLLTTLFLLPCLDMKFRVLVCATFTVGRHTIRLYNQLMPLALSLRQFRAPGRHLFPAPCLRRNLPLPLALSLRWPHLRLHLASRQAARARHLRRPRAPSLRQNLLLHLARSLRWSRPRLHLASRQAARARHLRWIRVPSRRRFRAPRLTRL